MMSRYLYAAIFTVLFCSSCETNKKQLKMPIDTNATEQTVNLYNRLFTLMDKGVMVAHQDDLSYGHDWYGEQGRSDVLDIVGDYPAVLGMDLGHLELGVDRNLDSVYFADMKRYVRETHQRGGITTFSWHGDNIVTGGSTWDNKETDHVVRSVLPNNENHERYLGWLDQLAQFFLELKDSKGQLIPVVFRLYHEHNASWFWWGNKQCTPEEYKQIWVMTVEYLRDKKQVHNILYAYSPQFCADEAEYLERYPGDEYVDIVGFDGYYYGSGDEALVHYKENMKRNIEITTAYAEKSGKLPIIAETGMESIPYDKYFTEAIYPLLNGQKISWILFWRNAWESDKPNHYYMPFPGHPAADDLKQFVAMPGILMTNDIR